MRNWISSVGLPDSCAQDSGRSQRSSLSSIVDRLAPCTCVKERRHLYRSTPYSGCGTRDWRAQTPQAPRRITRWDSPGAYRAAAYRTRVMGLEAENVDVVRRTRYTPFGRSPASNRVSWGPASRYSPVNQRVIRIAATSRWMALWFILLALGLATRRLPTRNSALNRRLFRWEELLMCPWMSRTSARWPERRSSNSTSATIWLRWHVHRSNCRALIVFALIQAKRRPSRFRSGSTNYDFLDWMRSGLLNPERLR